MQGKRVALLVTKQHTSDAFVKHFGAGREFCSRLFRSEQQPECLVLERRVKGTAAQQTKELLAVIPCRHPALCPIVALALTRVAQFGRNHAGLLPPAKIQQYGEGDHPLFDPHLGDHTAFRKSIDTGAVNEAVRELGHKVSGGVLTALRNVSVAMLSGNPDVSEVEELAVNEHSGKKRQKADTNYAKVDAGVTLAQACAPSPTIHAHQDRHLSPEP